MPNARLAFSLALFFLTAALLSHNALAFQGAAPTRLQSEGMTEPLGIDITHPRLSWQLQDSRRGARQTAYEVRVAASAEALAQDHADVSDSGKVDSDQSVNVPYGGPSPESRRRYYWQVRVWDAQGQPSPYSAATWWEMGLLSSQDWKAKWITRDMPLGLGDYESAPKWIWADNGNALTNATPGKHDFRFHFDLKGKPRAATLFITAKDNVAAWVNGKQVVVESPMGNFGRAHDPWGYFRVIPVGKLLSAGAKPNNIPLTMQTTAVKASTRRSRCNSRSIFARPLDNRASNTLPAHLAMTRPSKPPQHASNMLSVSSWRTSRMRRAPRLSRTAISRCRAFARVNKSAATLPQAISKTAPTIIINNKRELENCRLKLSRPCLTGMIRSIGLTGAGVGTMAFRS